MACTLSTGWTIPCKGSAGVVTAYIGTWNGPDLTYTLNSDNSIGTFSGSTVSFYTFEQPDSVASFTHEGQINNENWTFAMSNSLEITLPQMTQTLSNTIGTLGKGVWRVMIKDVNGNYWLMGKEKPVSVSAITGGLGKAATDLNGAIVTFTVTEADPIVKVSSTAALSLIV